MDDLLCPKIFSNELLKYFTFSAFWLRKLCRTQQASTVQMVFSKFWQMGDLRTRNLNKILGKYEFCTIESQLLIRFSFIVILTKITLPIEGYLLRYASGLFIADYKHKYMSYLP